MRDADPAARCRRTKKCRTTSFALKPNLLDCAGPPVPTRLKVFLNAAQLISTQVEKISAGVKTEPLGYLALLVLSRNPGHDLIVANFDVKFCKASCTAPPMLLATACPATFSSTLIIGIAQPPESVHADITLPIWLRTQARWCSTGWVGAGSLSPQSYSRLVA
jgi:hypothetical protein